MIAIFSISGERDSQVTAAAARALNTTPLVNLRHRANTHILCYSFPRDVSRDGATANYRNMGSGECIVCAASQSHAYCAKVLARARYAADATRVIVLNRLHSPAAAMVVRCVARGATLIFSNQ